MSVSQIFAKIGSALAALAMVATPIVASAQEAQPRAAVLVAPADGTITTVEPSMGLQILPAEWTRLKADDCLIGPLTTAQPLYDWAAKKNVRPCTPRFYAEVDNFLGKESVAFFRVTRTGQGWLHCDLVKATNLGNNRQSCITYPFNSSYNEQGRVGRMSDVNYSEGGDVVKARAFTAFGSALIAGPLTAFTAAKSQKMCDNCGDTFNIAGGQAVSASRSDASSASQVQFQGSFGGGTGPCNTCGVAPAPSSGGGSGHTQDGPGSAPYNGGS